MKKKKVAKKQKPIGRKQKIDVVIESLVNLEQKVKELIKEVEQLKNKQNWPNVPYRYDGVIWRH